MIPGKIFLIPSPIAATELDRMLPQDNRTVLGELKTFFVENVRTTRRFLSKVGIRNIDALQFFVLDKNTDELQIEEMLKTVRQGNHAGLLSEAGCPGIADPGSRLVRLAHKYGIRVIPLTGPSSIFLALMASGFNGQHFQFNGYLPIQKREREKQVLILEQLVYTKNQTQIFMETPYRNQQMLETLIKVLKPDTWLCIASDITSPHEFIRSMPIRQWKKKLPDIHKKPAVFLLYR